MVLPKFTDRPENRLLIGRKKSNGDVAFEQPSDRSGTTDARIGGEDLDSGSWLVNYRLADRYPIVSFPAPLNHIVSGDSCDPGRDNLVL